MKTENKETFGLRLPWIWKKYTEQFGLDTTDYIILDIAYNSGEDRFISKKAIADIAGLTRETINIHMTKMINLTYDNKPFISYSYDHKKHRAYWSFSGALEFAWDNRKSNENIELKTEVTEKSVIIPVVPVVPEIPKEIEKPILPDNKKNHFYPDGTDSGYTEEEWQRTSRALKNRSTVGIHY